MALSGNNEPEMTEDEVEKGVAVLQARLAALDEILEVVNESDGTAPHDDMGEITRILQRVGFTITPW